MCEWHAQIFLIMIKYIKSMGSENLEQMFSGDHGHFISPYLYRVRSLAHLGQNHLHWQAFSLTEQGSFSHSYDPGSPHWIVITEDVCWNSSQWSPAQYLLKWHLLMLQNKLCLSFSDSSALLLLLFSQTNIPWTMTSSSLKKELPPSIFLLVLSCFWLWAGVPDGKL